MPTAIIGVVWFAFLVFWVLLYVARDDLGIQGIAVAIAVWLALLAAIVLTGISPYYFMTAQAIIDIVLVLKVFGGDINIG